MTWGCATKTSWSNVINFASYIPTTTRVYCLSLVRPHLGSCQLRDSIGRSEFAMVGSVMQLYCIAMLDKADLDLEKIGRWCSDGSAAKMIVDVWWDYEKISIVLLQTVSWYNSSIVNDLWLKCWCLPALCVKVAYNDPAIIGNKECPTFKRMYRYRGIFTFVTHISCLTNVIRVLTLCLSVGFYCRRVNCRERQYSIGRE